MLDITVMTDSEIIEQIKSTHPGNTGNIGVLEVLTALDFQSLPPYI